MSEQKSYWDSEIYLAQVEKTPTSQYQVHAVEKSGKRYINIREWYCTKTDPTWKPSKSGMAIPLEQAEEVMLALKEGMHYFEKVAK
jgi:Transcriptional Coactivator p15 (PC4)